MIKFNTSKTTNVIAAAVAGVAVIAIAARFISKRANKNNAPIDAFASSLNGQAQAAAAAAQAACDASIAHNQMFNM